jgi:hypothetical protein
MWRNPTRKRPDQALPDPSAHGSFRRWSLPPAELTFAPGDQEKSGVSQSKVRRAESQKSNPVSSRSRFGRLASKDWAPPWNFRRQSVCFFVHKDQTSERLINLLIFFVGLVTLLKVIGMPIAFSFLLATVAYLKFRTSVPVLIVPGRVSEGMSYMVLPRNAAAPIWRIFPSFSAGSADGAPGGGPLRPGPISTADINLSRRRAKSL